MTDARAPGARLAVARVSRAHGLDGRLLVQEITDRPELVFVEGRVLRVEAAGPGTPERLTVSRARPHGRGWLLETRELTERSLAERYRGRWLTVDRDALPAPGRDEFYLDDLVGLSVRLASGEELGRVEAIYDAPAAPLLAVTVAGRERLIPFRREMVAAVDLEAGTLVARLPEGLLEV